MYSSIFHRGGIHQYTNGSMLCSVRSAMAVLLWLVCTSYNCYGPYDLWQVGGIHSIIYCLSYLLQKGASTTWFMGVAFGPLDQQQVGGVHSISYCLSYLLQRGVHHLICESCFGQLDWQQVGGVHSIRYDLSSAVKGRLPLDLLELLSTWSAASTGSLLNSLRPVSSAACLNPM